VLLLAGILLALSFILFSVQLSLVANIGQQAGRETRNPVLDDYLLIRRSMANTIQAEMTDADGDVVCPTDPADIGGRVEAFLVMLANHEQKRGQALDGRLLDVDIEVPNQVTVTISLQLTDGFSTIQDTLAFRYDCV
jgi:hypothetical protein